MKFTHSRLAWTNPREPITGPAVDWRTIDTVVIHYTAADDLIDGDPGEHADQLPAYMRAMQHAYLTSRGYSLGYCVAVDWLGGSWEIRGADIRCAANKDHNTHTFAILVLVDGNDMATHYAAAEIRRLVAEAEALAKRSLKIIGHGQLQNPNHPTGCPGSGLRAQITLGEFSPSWVNPMQPPTPTEDDEMNTARLWRHPAYLNTFLVGAGPAINVSPELFASYQAAGVPYIVEAHDQLLLGCMTQAGLTAANMVRAAA